MGRKHHFLKTETEYGYKCSIQNNNIKKMIGIQLKNGFLDLLNTEFICPKCKIIYQVKLVSDE